MERKVLSDICDLIVDCPHSTAKDEGVGYPLVRTPNIGKGRLLLDGVHRVSETVYNVRNERAVPQVDDIILAREAPVGNAAIITQGQNVCLGQRVVLIRANLNIADPKYLIYKLLSEDVQYRLKNCANGAVVAHLNMNDIRNLEIDLPELDIQHRIANILTNLDDKIELNNRINHNLEEQAQALYKSWFVDFEPFKDVKFIKSELGMIPEGWRVGTLGELLEIRYGKDHKKYSDGAYPVYGSGGLMRKVERPLFEGESVLIPRKGSLNNVMYVNEAFWSVDTMFYSVEKMPNVAKYCYQILSQIDLASMNSGSAVPSMTTDILNAIQVVIPDKKVLEYYNIILSRVFSSVASIRNESFCLVDIRNSILPKLMNGEILC